MTEKVYHSSLRHGADIEEMVQEIAYYIQTSQPPGFPLVTRSDALRYAVTVAAQGIRNETASQGRKPGEE